MTASSATPVTDGDCRDAYPLRISPEVLDAIQGWANDELRSLNAQIEYVLREALRKAGRIKAPGQSQKAAKAGE